MNYSITHLEYDPSTGSRNKVRYEFNKLYNKGDGFSENAEIGSSSSIIFFDNIAKTITTESKAITRVPQTGEKGVLSVKSIQFFDSIDFDASGEVVAYDPDSIIAFTYYESLESAFTYETGKSNVFPDSFSVDYISQLNSGVMYNGDKEADYVDFYYTTGSEDVSKHEYSSKYRDKYNSSTRGSLLLEKNVAGNFEIGWWDAISFDAANSIARYQLITASTWSESIAINRELTGTSGSGVLQAKQIEKDNWTGPEGSLITGSSSNDIIRGLAGWDILDGEAGDDLIHGGNGRDVIDGGSGSDELHGDFGWNTYKDQRDGSVDLIAIKSDQFLSNWWYGKAKNNADGRKADIIEGLDSNDQIKIIGVARSDLSFRDGISHKGVTGIGIYAKGVLEALYTGGDLSVGQVSAITTGDHSAQAMANQIWSYWGDNSAPGLLP